MTRRTVALVLAIGVASALCFARQHRLVSSRAARWLAIRLLALTGEL